MASARNLMPALRVQSVQHDGFRKVAIPAAVLMLLCGLCAFAFLVWHDQGHPKVMVHDQAAPLHSAASSKVSVAKTTTAPGAAATAGLEAQSSKLEQREFNLTGRNSTALLRSVKIRLIRASGNRHSYDLSVQERGRTRIHHNLRARQPVWIAGNRGEAPLELIVSTISKDAVSGYWREAGHSPQIAARAEKRQ